MKAGVDSGTNYRSVKRKKRSGFVVNFYSRVQKCLSASIFKGFEALRNKIGTRRIVRHGK